MLGTRMGAKNRKSQEENSTKGLAGHAVPACTLTHRDLTCYDLDGSYIRADLWHTNANTHTYTHLQCRNCTILDSFSSVCPPRKWVRRGRFKIGEKAVTSLWEPLADSIPLPVDVMQAFFSFSSLLFLHCSLSYIFCHIFCLLVALGPQSGKVGENHAYSLWVTRSISSKRVDQWRMQAVDKSGKQNSLLKIFNSGILLLVHLATATLEKGSETTPKWLTS